MKRLWQLIQRKSKTSPSEQVPLISDLQPGAKRVYWLSEELANDPESLAQTHELTQDQSRPLMGLAGRHGLFATDTWWQSVNAGRIRIKRVAGVITRVYRAGQDNSGPVNSVAVTTSDGSSETIGIYLNHKSDRKYFSLGNFVEIVYALDDCKGNRGQAEIALEVVVVDNTAAT